MQGTFQQGGIPSRISYQTPFFGPAEVAQTIDPVAPVVVVNGTIVFTTNLPANWTATGGSIVAAADGLSATFTAPGAPAIITVTATNQADPGNTASTPVTVTSFGPLAQGDFVPQGPAARSIVGDC